MRTTAAFAAVTLVLGAVPPVDTGEAAFRATRPAAPLAETGTTTSGSASWQGSDTGLEIEGFEIFVRRLDATGAEVGVNDLRISDMAGSGDPAFDAGEAAIAWGGTGNPFLVVWEGEDDVGGLVEGELEIFGQMLVGTAVFADGFESGDTGSWSATVF